MVVATCGSSREAAKLICPCFSVLPGVARALPLGAPVQNPPLKIAANFRAFVPHRLRWDFAVQAVAASRCRAAANGLQEFSSAISSKRGMFLFLVLSAETFIVFLTGWLMSHLAGPQQDGNLRLHTRGCRTSHRLRHQAADCA